jgi:hypothetical protein
MSQPHEIALLMMHGGSPADVTARHALIAALGAGVTAIEPDETGVFAVTVEADDLEAALTKVWNAIAASGSDDHLVLLEHPSLPDHWRVRGKSPDALPGGYS